MPGNATLDAALAYARRGLLVFPVAPRGKRPHACLGGEGGHRHATTNANKITAWFTKHPDANIGIACDVSGIVVIDVDTANGKVGAETFASLVAQYGEPPVTVEQVSGSGGRQLIFDAGDDLDPPGRLGRHVDVKYAGYIVAEPSIHPSGGRYHFKEGRSFDDLEPAPLPLAWREALTKREPERVGDDDWSVPIGERHDYMVKIAGTLRQTLALTPDEIEDVLQMLAPRFEGGDEAEPMDAHIAKVARSTAQWAPGQVPWKFRADNGRGKQDGTIEATPYSAIERRQIRWLDSSIGDRRIAYGEVTLLVGDPGLGKSQLTCLLAADISTQGRLVGIASAEDSPEYTIRPRLEAAGADLDRVHQLGRRSKEGIIEAIRLPDDLGLLRDRLDALGGIELLVIDPLMAHLPVAIDSYRDQHVRSAIAPLKQLADDYGCAIVVVQHLKKSGGDQAIYRVGGSIGFTAAARSVLLLARDPEDEQGEFGPHRVLANIKNNLAREAPSLRCHVEQVPVMQGPTSMSLDTTSRIVIGDECSISGNELLFAAGESKSDKSSVEEAVHFLRETLVDGPLPVGELKTLAKAVTISEITLRRAKDKLGIGSEKQEGVEHGGWVWRLPDAQDDHG